MLLIERDRVARGATGHNAGQLTTYFERPLYDIADEFGADMAIEGQRAFDDAHDLLDLMAAEAGATVRIERFTGHMGMFSAEPPRGPPAQQPAAPRTAACARRRASCPRTRSSSTRSRPSSPGSTRSSRRRAIRELLETDDDRYRAVLSDRKGCANSGALVQQVLAYLERRYPDRFRYVDQTLVERVVVGDDGVTLHARGHAVTASQVVLCTNGFVDHVVEDEAGEPIGLADDQQVVGTIGYMAAFVEERAAHAGGDELHPQRDDRRRHARTST